MKIAVVIVPLFFTCTVKCFSLEGLLTSTLMASTSNVARGLIRTCEEKLDTSISMNKHLQKFTEKDKCLVTCLLLKIKELLNENRHVAETMMAKYDSRLPDAVKKIEMQCTLPGQEDECEDGYGAVLCIQSFLKNMYAKDK